MKNIQTLLTLTEPSPSGIFACSSRMSLSLSAASFWRFEGGGRTVAMMERAVYVVKQELETSTVEAEENEVSMVS